MAARKKGKRRSKKKSKAGALPADCFPQPSLHRVLDPDGAVVGPMPDVDVATMRRMYATMMLVRALDERMMILQRQGRVGFYGACTGQEATPIGTAAALRDADWIFPALREGSVMLYRGFSLESYMCQVFGNSGDVLLGRQMPSHQSDRGVNQVSWSSCIGTQLPHAVGAGWAAKICGDDTVTVGFMGDGATSEADFHCALNFAGVYGAPTILICQNNHWSISVPTANQSNVRTFAEKAVAYGVPYARVDGNDILAVYAAVDEAARRARTGGGPTFLEMLTYRIGAHSSSDDPRVYRSEDEVETWKKRDPVERFRAFLLAEGHWSADEEAALRKSHNDKILAAVEAAEARPAPPVSSLIEDVFAEVPRTLQEQAQAWLTGDDA